MDYSLLMQEPKRLTFCPIPLQTVFFWAKPVSQLIFQEPKRTSTAILKSNGDKPLLVIHIPIESSLCNSVYL